MGRLTPTPTEHRLKLRIADFSTLAEALDYAADGDTGCNFYSGKGELLAVVPYAQLREDALALARRFKTLGLQRGARVALMATTHPNFQRYFFACQYAGLIPVPVAPPLHLGGRGAYVEHLRGLLADCDASVGVTAQEHIGVFEEAAEGLRLRFVGSPEDFAGLPDPGGTLQPLGPGELAHLQYTSGSTRFPRGAMIGQRAVLANLSATLEHVGLRPDDRMMSWLPYYHDMGLVGLVLGSVVSQTSVDFLGTPDFAMRPRQWLVRMTESRATISFSPPFGYELCARRLRGEDAESFDLSAWRIAGVGAEIIRPGALARFAEAVAPSGFDPRAFLPCYGLAESSLAVSLAEPFTGARAEWVDGQHLSERGEARRVAPPDDETSGAGPANHFVYCGRPLPGHEIAIRDEHGADLPDRKCGSVYVRGPSIMDGYFANEAINREVLTAEGWLDTGDVGYRSDGEIVIVGRVKDLIIINGRNIRPQDLEYLAEQQPEVRPGDASAFSVPGHDGAEQAVLVLQCRESDADKRRDLTRRLDRAIRAEHGIGCIIDLVPPHTLVRTSSGKLSRSRTRQDFLERTRWGRAAQAG